MSQASIMRYLETVKKPKTAVQIAQRLGLTSSTVQMSLRKLFKQGEVKRKAMILKTWERRPVWGYVLSFSDEPKDI